jgi:hypothetical protein
MRYAFDLLIPADTPIDAPATREVILSNGTVKRCIVYFHDGCFNHVYSVVTDALFQIVPANGTTALFGNDHAHDIPMDFPLLDSPYALTLSGWSPGTRYEHTLNFWFDLEQDELAVKDQFIDLLERLQAGE